MLLDQQAIPADQIIADVLPSTTDDGRSEIVRFVRALAIRQARIDAANRRAPNDNERGIIH